MAFIISLAIGLIIAFIAVGNMKSAMKSVREQTGAKEYVKQNSMNITGKYDTLVNETLAEYQNPEHEVHGVLNQAYLGTSAREALNPTNLFLIFFSVTVVFLCSFLLIYNVYSIALTQDMQAFGLLNVIGTTHKQMRRMTVIQSMILFAGTLPVGLLAGYFIGWKMFEGPVK